MKKKVHRLSEVDLRYYPIKGIVEGWHFRIDEISYGYYRVTGIDEWGRTVSRDGIDPQNLLSRCREEIQNMLPDIDYDQ